MEQALEKLVELGKAKDNVKWLLDNESGSVDMKGLEYWAKRVIELRKQVKESL